MSENPILNPEVDQLRQGNALLREELGSLLAEIEQLTQVEKPNLLALYQTKMGAWELRRLEAQCALARLRREVELIQASLNRAEEPDLPQIQGLLELEFIEWQQRLREAAERLGTAEHRLEHLMQPDESQEFKRLYRALVKRLHPDLNPELAEAQRTLWHRVQSAYAHGDLNELRALILLTEESTVAPPPKPIEVLRAERATLSRQITTLLARIERIKAEPPFTLETQLGDDTWIEARRRELESEIGQLNAQIQALAAHRQQLLSRGAHAAEFGPN